MLVLRMDHSLQRNDVASLAGAGSEGVRLYLDLTVEVCERVHQMVLPCISSTYELPCTRC